MIKFLPIEFSEVPIDKVYTLNGTDYTFKFRYNSKYDFITLEIYKENEFLYSGKLVYGNNLLQNNKIDVSFEIVPLKESDLEKLDYENLKVNKETLGQSVFLYFDDGSN